MADEFIERPAMYLSIFRKSHNIFFSVLSAILLSLSFCRFNLGALAWFALVPLFFVLENKPRTILASLDPPAIKRGGKPRTFLQNDKQSSKKVRAKSKWRVFLLFYLSGVIFWFGTIYWLIHVTLPGMIILSLYLALYFGFFGLFIKSYELRVRSGWRVGRSYGLLFIPSLWVCLEYIRGHLFTGFPWAILGYSQYKNLPIIQIADIVGVYGVSFLIVMVNLTIYFIVRQRIHVAEWGAFVVREKKKYSLPLLCVFIVLSYGYYRLKPATGDRQLAATKISVIQGNIPQELKWEVLAKEKIVEKYFWLTKMALRDNPDFIIWPETALPDYLMIEKKEYSNIESLRDFLREINAPLLAGMVSVKDNNFYNSAVLFSKTGDILNRYDKLHLVPFGEYIPLRKIFSFLEAFVPIGDFRQGKEYAVFNHQPKDRRHQPINFSILICFEDIFPELSRRFVDRGANFLINITNDAWFMDTAQAYQHLAASVFRAVENRVSVVRSANTGVSCFILPSGRIKLRLSDDKGKDTFIAGHITDVISKNLKLSIYNRYGDIFVLLCFLITSYGIIINPKRPTPQRGYPDQK